MSVSTISESYIGDLFNPAKTYKFIFEPNLQKLTTVSTKDQKIVNLAFENLTLRVDWKPYEKQFTMDIIDGDTLLRRSAHTISYSISLLFNPSIPGVPVHILFYFDMTDINRTMYIYKSLDILEEY